MSCGFKADLAGDCSKAEKSKESDGFGKLNHGLGTMDGSGGPSGLIQLFPCDMRDSLSTWTRPEPSTLRCKPQSSGLQWG